MPLAQLGASKAPGHMIRSMPTPTIAVLHGDQTGEELLREALRLLEAGVIGLTIEKRDFELSHAKRIEAKVCGGPKSAVSPVYEGMFKEELDAAAKRHPDVRYDPQLIDATYALLVATTVESLVIPALNRDGDTLSDLVIQMFGTIAGAESTLLAFDDRGAVNVAMTEAPHRTAPSLQGKNVANPMAMILAVASLLGYMKEDLARRASRTIYEAALEAVSDGVRTADLAGDASTTEFTDEVIRRVRTKVDVWSALADVER